MSASWDGGPIGQLERYQERRKGMITEDGRLVYGWWLRWQHRVATEITEEQIRKEAAAAAKLQEETL